jgi:hypothetical protein
MSANGSAIPIGQLKPGMKILATNTRITAVPTWFSGLGWAMEGMSRSDHDRCVGVV